MNSFRGFSLNAICQGLIYTLGLLNHVLLTRHLSEKDYGNLAVCIPTVMFGALLFGEWMNRGGTYVVGRERAREEAIGNALTYGLILSLPVLAAVFLRQTFSDSFASLLPLPPLLVAGLIVFNTLQKAGMGILLGDDRIKLYPFVPLIFICLYVGGNLLAHFTIGLDLENVLWIWLIAMAASAVAAFLPFFRSSLRIPTPSRAVFKRTLEVGRRGAISFILIFLLFRANIWLIKFILGAETLATYRVAINFADMMQRLPNVAGVVLLAKVVRGQDEDGRLSLPVARGILAFSTASALALLLLGPFFIDLFFPKYPEAYIPLVWMLPGLIFAGFGSVFNTKLAGQGFPPVTMWAPGIALCLNIPLNLWLIPSMGLRGAALTTSITFTLWGLIVSSYYLRQAGLGWRDFLRLRGPTRTI